MSDYPDGLGPDDPTAQDNAHTDISGVSFTLKEGVGGELKIMLEEDEPGLPFLRRSDGFLMFHFRDGYTYEQSQAFVTALNDHIKSASHTVFLT